MSDGECRLCALFGGPHSEHVGGFRGHGRSAARPGPDEVRRRWTLEQAYREAAELQDEDQESQREVKGPSQEPLAGSVGARVPGREVDVVTERLLEVPEIVLQMLGDALATVRPGTQVRLTVQDRDTGRRGEWTAVRPDLAWVDEVQQIPWCSRLGQECGGFCPDCGDAWEKQFRREQIRESIRKELEE